jgi:hypothetical protein
VAASLAAASSGSVFGAREVQRAIRRQVVDAIAEAVASRGAECLEVGVVDGAIVARDIPALPAPGAAHTVVPLRAPEAAGADQARVAAARLRALRSLLMSAPGRRDHLREAARALVALGRAARVGGRRELACKFLRGALALWTRLLPDGDCPDEIALEVASSHLGLHVLVPDAEQRAAHLVAALRFLGHAPGESARTQRVWLVARQALGQLGIAR